MDGQLPALYDALVSSRRAVALSNQMLRSAFDSLNAIDKVLSMSGAAIETTRQRLAQPAPPEQLWAQPRE